MNLEIGLLMCMKNYMPLDIISSSNCEESNKIKQFDFVTFFY